MIRLLSVCIAVDRRLAAWIVTLGVLQGLLLPGFMLATGSLVGALSSGRSPTVPLVVVGVVFTGRRLLDPVSAELSAMLMRRVDESLSERVMGAMATPPGLSHVEDPVVLNAAVQAEGALTGATPGGAAAYLGFFIKGRVAAAAALLIVASYRPLLVPLLVLAYVLAFRFTRWHWYQVAQVMHGGTEALRRSFYLRTLALTPTVSKEIRVFGLAGWLSGDTAAAGWPSCTTCGRHDGKVGFGSLAWRCCWLRSRLSRSASWPGTPQGEGSASAKQSP